jgi:hypothetical protein
LEFIVAKTLAISGDSVPSRRVAGYSGTLVESKSTEQCAMRVIRAHQHEQGLLAGAWRIKTMSSKPTRRDNAMHIM